ncbi:hypothetical protein CFIO01_12044 [Colletotrichum fioriniae PJ7]|uniref:Uncharacterized protein n=1 Tax=Colletotrichum fioriniae PJ7 TaxID=1445577 RepID=A0A010S3B5_9PEZI|nr:hypothetical protein CFIO01_12044 [Colletotrichum fioriniae PJ7]
MKFFANAALLILGLFVSVNATPQKKGGGVAGQACTDGTSKGTCSADGRCGLEIPPNELSSQIVAVQYGR